MAFISIQADVSDAVRQLTIAQQKQVPFAIAKSLTALAFEAQRSEQVGIRQTFAHPRPFTQRATLVDKATKSNPVATVFIRPEAAAYLAPFEFGGPHHIPGRGLAMVMPVNLSLDAYGQIKGRPSGIKAQPGTFVATITFKRSGKTVSGFWRRPQYGERRDGTRGSKGNTRNRVGGTNTGLTLLAEFETQPLQVNKSLYFQARARAVVMARGRQVFATELQKALATAK